MGARQRIGSGLAKCARFNIAILLVTGQVDQPFRSCGVLVRKCAGLVGLLMRENSLRPQACLRRLKRLGVAVSYACQRDRHDLW